MHTKIFKKMAGLTTALALGGCIYAGNVGPVTHKYAVLYGEEQWRQDTGLAKEQLMDVNLPLWNQPEGQDRLQVASVPLGSTVEILVAEPKSYQVIDPATGIIGWIEKIYVKNTYLRSNAPDPVDYPFGAQAKNQESSQVQGISQAPAETSAIAEGAGSVTESKDVKVITR